MRAKGVQHGRFRVVSEEVPARVIRPALHLHASAPDRVEKLLRCERRKHFLQESFGFLVDHGGTLQEPITRGR